MGAPDNLQKKASWTARFELTPDTQKSLVRRLECRGGTLNDFVFPSRIDFLGHLSTRQYARLVYDWLLTEVRSQHSPINERRVLGSRNLISGGRFVSESGPAAVVGQCQLSGIKNNWL